MCRGELADLTKLAPRTPNDLFLSVSHHCTLTPARPQSRIKYSRWTQFACKERSFQGTETAPPTYHFESKREQLGESLFRNRSPVSYRIRTKGIGKILHSPRYRSTASKAFPAPPIFKIISRKSSNIFLQIHYIEFRNSFSALSTSETQKKKRYPAVILVLTRGRRGWREGIFHVHPTRIVRTRGTSLMGTGNGLGWVDNPLITLK